MAKKLEEGRYNLLWLYIIISITKIEIFYFFFHIYDYMFSTLVIVWSIAGPLKFSEVMLAWRTVPLMRSYKVHTKTTWESLQTAGANCSLWSLGLSFVWSREKLASSLVMFLLQVMLQVYNWPLQRKMFKTMHKIQLFHQGWSEYKPVQLEW